MSTPRSLPLPASDARMALARIEGELRSIVRRSPAVFSSPAFEAHDQITATINAVGRLYVLIGLVKEDLK